MIFCQRIITFTRYQRTDVFKDENKEQLLIVKDKSVEHFSYIMNLCL